MASELVNSATSDKLPEVNWAKYIEICELVARDQRQAKDVIKAIKKRLGSKSANAQLYAVMLLEMLLNNIGEPVHNQVIEAGLLSILVKIVKKKSDNPVRERIFLLLDATQTSVGGQSGKFPQYYKAYYELVSAGVKFPQRPPVSSSDHHTSGASQNTLTVANTASASEDRSMKTEEPQPAPGSSIIEKATAASEVLREVLDAVDAQNPEAAKDEFTRDLVEQCSFQKDRVMHLIMSSRDEKLVLRAIKLNEQLGRVLERHEALVSHRPASSASQVELPERVIPASNHSNNEGRGTWGRKLSNHVGQPTSAPNQLDREKAEEEEPEKLSHSIIEKATAALEVLREVLDAVNAQNPEAAKDEFTLDLVEQCSFQKDRVMHLVMKSRDEKLVLRAIELNEQLGRVLERHEALVSHRPVPSASPSVHPERVIPTLNHNNHEDSGSWASKNTDHVGQSTSTPNHIDFEEIEEEEEAEQLSHRIRKGKAHVRPEDDEIAIERPLGLLGSSSPSERLHRPLIRSADETKAPPLAVSIPPPPAKHVEREKFFKEKKGGGTPLAGHMRGLSLHSRNGSNSSFTGSFASSE
ncbi:TOM1-like protein 5 [Silene latifolia]|uniref:TOM1-like protein 5 n=1 Tax=Silene latifolia TaxID=37657 RepID=UPI003D782286